MMTRRTAAVSKKTSLDSSRTEATMAGVIGLTFYFAAFALFTGMLIFNEGGREIGLGLGFCSLLLFQLGTWLILREVRKYVGRQSSAKPAAPE